MDAFLRIAAAAAVAVVCASAPATAEVLYTLVETGVSPTSASATFTGNFLVSDGVASGQETIFRNNRMQPNNLMGLSGLLAANLVVVDHPHGVAYDEGTLSYIQPPFPALQYITQIVNLSVTGNYLTGNLLYEDASDSLELRLNANGTFAALYNSDGASAACQGNSVSGFTSNNHGCLFTGYEIVTDVPEPTSMALLGTGLVGFGIARRRKLRML